MFLVTMFRMGGWKGLVAAIVIGTAARMIMYHYLFHNAASILMNAQSTRGGRSAFAAGWNAGHGSYQLVPPAQDAADAEPMPGAPVSSWVSYAATDANSGERVYHAKLSAMPTARDAADAGAPQVFSQIEFQQTGHRDGVARLTLARVAPANCIGITGIEARFDNGAPRMFDAKMHEQDPMCTVDITDFAAFRDLVLNAQMLRAAPATASARLDPVFWQVGGLAWDVN